MPQTLVSAFLPQVEHQQRLANLTRRAWPIGRRGVSTTARQRAGACATGRALLGSRDAEFFHRPTCASPRLSSLRFRFQKSAHAPMPSNCALLA